MTEKRQSPRTQCRLHCRILRGRDRIRARVLDVSQGGLCVLSPVELQKGESLAIEIDVPGHGTVNVQAFVWHVRRTTSKATHRKSWSAGLILTKSDDTNSGLFTATAENGPFEPTAYDDTTETEDGLNVFRVRVQIEGTPRSRILTLSAATEDEAIEMTTKDLEEPWSIVEVLSERMPLLQKRTPVEKSA